MKNYPLVVGATAERRRRVSEEDIVAFAEATGDRNPVHLDEVFARNTRFGGRIAHGMLVASFISAVLADELPGPGTIYLGQSLRFITPVRIGDEITTRVEVLEIISEKSRARLSTVCRNQDGITVLEGEATVLLPSAA